MSVVGVDDTNTLITYGGSWQVLEGTAQQPAFQSTLHSTVDSTASASMIFQGKSVRSNWSVYGSPFMMRHWVGTRLMIFCALPSSTSANSIHAVVDFDGKTSTITHPTNATSVFNFVLYDTGTIPQDTHTVILSNTGHLKDSPLQLDRFIIEGETSKVGPEIGPSNTASVFTPAQTSDPTSNATPTLSTGGNLSPLAGSNSVPTLTSSTHSILSSPPPPGGIAAFDSSDTAHSTGELTSSESHDASLLLSTHLQWLLFLTHRFL